MGADLARKPVIGLGTRSGDALGEGQTVTSTQDATGREPPAVKSTQHGFFGPGSAARTVSVLQKRYNRYGGLLECITAGQSRFTA